MRRNMQTNYKIVRLSAWYEMRLPGRARPTIKAAFVDGMGMFREASWPCGRSDDRGRDQQVRQSGVLAKGKDAARWWLVRLLFVWGGDAALAADCRAMANFPE